MRKTQLSYIPLRKKFVLYLSSMGIDTFRTSDAHRWYKQMSTGLKKVPYSNLYALILRPLEVEGVIRKLERGQWLLVKEAEMVHVLNEEAACDSDWESYIRDKLDR